MWPSFRLIIRLWAPASLVRNQWGLDLSSRRLPITVSTLGPGGSFPTLIDFYLCLQCGGVDLTFLLLILGLYPLMLRSSFGINVDDLESGAVRARLSDR
ncbi:hypothetical protein CDL15_Pgr020230 [Punica granatum]|uniref:Uncharacterized protein n=1 Tax=Punica granatum TaxID=22663 RepID=A0A218VRF9_PUNGR|nr:hypothetical protein CDL15_Pgr020230 [Punica granatum]PKI51525.1 hypothetical protein CRG98_028085 [Punica granatum]